MKNSSILSMVIQIVTFRCKSLWTLYVIIKEKNIYFISGCDGTKNGNNWENDGKKAYNRTQLVKTFCDTLNEFSPPFKEMDKNLHLKIYNIADLNGEEFGKKLNKKKTMS